MLVIRIAICDDNPQELRQYITMLKNCIKRVGIAATLEEYTDPKHMLFEMDDPRKMPDILYMDIHMPGMDGITASKRLQRLGYDGQLIFLTNSSSHWKQAFDLHAFNYFVKGESEERFHQVFDSALEELNRRNEEYIILSSCGETVNVSIRSIRYFESYRNILTVHYDEDKTFEFYSTLGSIHEQLLEHHFLRIHKSYLVSALHIEKLVFDTACLDTGTKLPVGRTYYKEVKRQLEKLSMLDKAEGAGK